MSLDTRSTRAAPARAGRRLRLSAVCVWAIAALWGGSVALAGGAAPGGDRSAREWVPGRIIVQPVAGVSEARLERILASLKGRGRARIAADSGVLVIEVPRRAEDAIVRALSRNPGIRFAEKDWLIPMNETPDDPRLGSAWHLDRIDAARAWDYSRGEGIVVAVLDTGVDASHPDLQGKLLPGFNAVDLSGDTADINGHGTRVAGVVGAATDNGVGVAAVAWDARILPVRVSNRSDGVASTSDMARGLMWAADNGADVANISYQSWRHPAIQSAAQYMRSRGGVVVAAAGNDGTDTGYTPNPYVIVVAATTSSDATASWSNYGAYVDLAAPGSGIITTSRGGGYSSVSGTSFATPVVAGSAALVMAADPSLTPAQVEQVLYDSADDLGTTGWDPRYGWGRVNAGRAVALVAPEPVDVTAPAVQFLSPADGAAVEGDAVSVSVSALDDVEVTRVDLFVGNRLIGSETAAPWQFLWETESDAEGILTLRAEAWDKAGNRGEDTIQVTLSRPVPDPVDIEGPAVAFIEPSANERVRGVVPVELSAADESGVARVDLYVGDRLVGTATVAPYQIAWDTTDDAEGTIALTAEAFDTLGNRATRGIQVIVEREPPPQPIDALPPQVLIVSPPNGAKVDGSVVVEVDASDAGGIAHVQLFAGNRLVGTRNAPPWRWTWDTDDHAAGTVMLTAVATDAAGNQSSAGSSVTIERAPQPEPEPAPEPEPQSPQPQPSQPPQPQPEPVIAPPVVEFLAPAIDETVSGTVRILVRASGEREIATIRVRVDGAEVCSAAGATLLCDWSTAGLAAGGYGLVATAEDTAGNTGLGAVAVRILADEGVNDAGGVVRGEDAEGGAGAGFPLVLVPFCMWRWFRRRR